MPKRPDTINTENDGSQAADSREAATQDRGIDRRDFLTGMLVAAGGAAVGSLLPVRALAGEAPEGATKPGFQKHREHWETVGSLATARSQHCITALPGGSAIVTGGEDRTVGLYRSTELFDPLTLTFKPGPDMPTDRGYHGANPLPGGDVEIFEGNTQTDSAPVSTFIYRSKTNDYVASGDLPDRESIPACFPIPVCTIKGGKHDGDIFQAGGMAFQISDGMGGISLNEIQFGGTRKTRRFDSKTRQWIQTADMSVPRFTPAAICPLGNGKVLIAGGTGFTGYSFKWNGLTYKNKTGAFTVGRTVAGSISGAQGTILSDSNPGPTGAGLLMLDPATITKEFAEAEIVTDRATGSATTDFLSQPFNVCGPYPDNATAVFSSDTMICRCEIYDADTDTFTETDPLPEIQAEMSGAYEIKSPPGRPAGHQARRMMSCHGPDKSTGLYLEDGKVLVAGGFGPVPVEFDYSALIAALNALNAGETYPNTGNLSPMIRARSSCLIYDLNADSTKLEFKKQTQAWPVTPFLLTGHTSGANGTVTAVYVRGSAGTLTFDAGVTGTFQDGEPLTANSGNGVAHGSQTGGHWRKTGPMIAGRANGLLLPLQNGDIIAFGGTDETWGKGSYITEIFNVETETWRQGPDMPVFSATPDPDSGRLVPTLCGNDLSWGCVLADGRVLCAGSFPSMSWGDYQVLIGGPPTATAILFTPGDEETGTPPGTPLASGYNDFSAGMMLFES